MKRRSQLTIFLLLSVLLLSTCTGNRNSSGQVHNCHQKSLVIQAAFREGELSYFEQTALVRLDGSRPVNFYVGDVRGDSEHEIVVVTEDTIYLYTLNGKLIEARTFEEMNFGGGILSDIDGDGKLDIVLGSAGDKGVTIHAYSGVFTRLFEFLALHIYNAETKVHFFKEGRVYFSAHSPLLSSPKVIGAYDVEKDILQWEYYTGPAPIDIAANRDFTLLTISNRPTNTKGINRRETQVSDHSRHRASLYVLEPDGRVITQLSVGAEEQTAEFTENGISSLTSRLCDLDGNGKDELLIGMNRLSEFYRGKTALELRSLEGTLLHRHEFMPATELEFSFSTGDEQEEIAVLLKQQGRFYILDSSLQIKHEWLSPGLKAEGSLHCSGDFNGDGHIEHLLSIGNYLFILNSRSEPLFCTAFTADIHKALITVDRGGNPILLVHAESLHIFHIGEGGYGSATVHTNPPGAEIFVDGSKIDTPPERGVIHKLPAGELSFQARLQTHRSETHVVQIEAGDHVIVELELKEYREETESTAPQSWDIIAEMAPKQPINRWSDLALQSRIEKQEDEIFVFSGYRDLAGGPEKDLLFRVRGSPLYRTYSTDMKLLGQFRSPPDSFTMDCRSAWPDTKHDGKAEILFFRARKQELYLFNAEGRLLGYKKFFDLPDSLFRSHTVYKDGQLYIAVSSGYSEQPRGIMGVDIDSLEPGFFYPTAAMTTGLLITPDKKILPATYTPDNGSTITYPGGDTSNDSEYFVHIADMEGTHLSQSFKPSFEENNGHLRYFLADLETNGSKETFLLTGKTEYRSGTCLISALDTEIGSVSKPLFSGGDNTSMHIHSAARLEGRRLLTVFIGSPKELFLLSENFVPIRKFNLSERGYLSPQNWAFRDLNGDGSSEMLLLNDNFLSIYDLDFKLLYRIKSDDESGPFRNLILDDRGVDGKADIIIISEKAVSTYSY